MVASRCEEKIVRGGGGAGPGLPGTEEKVKISKQKVLLLVAELGVSFESGDWQRVSIPMDALELGDAQLEWVRLSGDVTGTFYLDDLRFVAEVPVYTEPMAVEWVEGSVVPSGYALSPNYPNPFNPETTIAYDLPEAGSVTLTVYSITGQKVATLVEDRQEAGRHIVSFDGTGYGSGIYLYRLESEGYAEMRRMVLVK